MLKLDMVDLDLGSLVLLLHIVNSIRWWQISSKFFAAKRYIGN